MMGETRRNTRTTNRLRPQKQSNSRASKPAKPQQPAASASAPPSPGQGEVNVIALRMKIEEDKKHAARAKAFKASEDRKWAAIKDERIRKRRAKEEHLRESRRKG